MDAEFDPYRVLGVEPSASLLDIARARRQLAKLHHPDLVAGEAAAGEMGRINAAWTLLADPAARAAWDEANGLRVASGAQRGPVTWTEWAYPPAPRAPEAPGARRHTAWWVLGLFVLFLVVVVAGGVMGRLDRPDVVDSAPWLQDNLGGP